MRWKIAARETKFLNLEEDVGKHAEKAAIIREREREICVFRSNPRRLLPREREAEEDLNLAATNYEKSINTNLQNESTARAERNKWLIQLKSMIQKYDQTLSERFFESLYLEDVFKELKARHEDFVNRYYNHAEQMYLDIVKSKEYAEEKKRLSKVRAWVENRAARVIQLAYRAYLRIHKPELVPKEAKRKGKGKPKKGK